MSDAVRKLRDGREICKCRTVKGKREYKRRIELMWERQGGMCRICHRPLLLSEATFDHEDGRGMNGSHRDDRIEKDGVPYNAVACLGCNVRKGSKRGY